MSTRCTGPVELLKNGEAGYLAENSTEGIKCGLKAILTQPEIYRRLVLAAKENTEYFDIEKQINMIDHLLEE